MGDEHRVLVDGKDRLGNIEQIRALRAAGFKGAISMESFAPEVHASQNPKADLARSFEYIAAQVAEVNA
jgi:2-keto-myo-inositol isomerase